MAKHPLAPASAYTSTTLAATRATTMDKTIRANTYTLARYAIGISASAHVRRALTEHNRASRLDGRRKRESTTKYEFAAAERKADCSRSKSVIFIFHAFRFFVLCAAFRLAVCVRACDIWYMANYYAPSLAHSPATCLCLSAVLAHICHIHTVRQTRGTHSSSSVYNSFQRRPGR